MTKPHFRSWFWKNYNLLNVGHMNFCIKYDIYNTRIIKSQSINLHRMKYLHLLWTWPRTLNGNNFPPFLICGPQRSISKPLKLRQKRLGQIGIFFWKTRWVQKRHDDFLKCLGTHVLVVVLRLNWNHINKQVFLQQLWIDGLKYDELGFNKYPDGLNKGFLLCF